MTDFDYILDLIKDFDPLTLIDLSIKSLHMATAKLEVKECEYEE